MGSTLEFKMQEGTAIPPGVIVPYAGTSDIPGWMIADGRWLLIADYPELFAAIGYSYSNGPPLYIQVPPEYFQLPYLISFLPVGYTKIGGAFIDRLPNRGWNNWGNWCCGCALGCVVGSLDETLSSCHMMGHSHGSSVHIGCHCHYYSPAATNERDHTHCQSVPVGGINPLIGTPITRGAYRGTGTCKLCSCYHTGTHAHTATVTGATMDHTHCMSCSGWYSTASHNNVQPTLALNYLVYTGV